MISTTTGAASPDPLAALRTTTHAHHERIDALVQIDRLSDPVHYARVLQVFDAFLAAWEPAVAAALPAWRLWLQARSRRAFLQQDLRALGLPAAAPADLPPFGDAAAAWGSVYVMEGSALGGRVIARELVAHGIAAAYFRGWGDATGALWRETRERLAVELAAPADLARACDAARATFDSLSALFEKARHERTALV